MGKKYNPPPQSLANLKPPWKPGQSGNPSGNRKSVYFRKALRKVFLARIALSEGMKVSRLDHQLRRVYDTSIALLDDVQTLKDFNRILPFLKLLKETLDGEDPAIATLKKSRESLVYLVGPRLTKEEELRAGTGSVELPGIIRHRSG